MPIVLFNGLLHMIAHFLRDHRRGNEFLAGRAHVSAHRNQMRSALFTPSFAISRVSSALAEKGWVRDLRSLHRLGFRIGGWSRAGGGKPLCEIIGFGAQIDRPFRAFRVKVDQRTDDFIGRR